VRLRVDQHHLDVAAVGGDGGRQIVEQAGAILGDDLDQGGGAAGFGIERYARLNAGLWNRNGPGPCGSGKEGELELRDSRPDIRYCGKRKESQL
jgi:hypothetical protein